ncbi:MAG: hypothetical protein ACYS6W_11270 [Planctomycetota bacterium]|jgi:hypothetical protein
MKRWIRWLVVVVIGFILMAFSYYNYQYEAGDNPWEDAFMYIGKATPNSEAEGLEYVKRPIRLLPIGGRAQIFAMIADSVGPHVGKSYRVSFQEKVILYSDMADDFTEEMLEWGQFPSPGADEVIAGFQAKSKDKITIDGRAFKIVGQLKKEVRLFAESYLISDDAVAGALFDANDEAVRNAYILQLPREQLTDVQMQERLKKAFPKSQFVAHVPLIRTEPGPFYLYVAGLSLLFLGGSLVLFKLYCFLSGWLGNKWLRLPLAEIRKYKHLFLTLHLIYFGIVVLFMLVAYNLPELQVCLLAVIGGAVEGPGPLAVAVKAYMSKNILWAAVITFAINFPLGSLASITLPSVIVPGAGILIACWRAALWGLLLAPTFVELSGAMLPHSFTLLLEGEAYIIATFFGLLVLVYLFRKAEGQGVGRRYGKALLMNVRGNLWVAIVLVVAAIYEAIEVILTM